MMTFLSITSLAWMTMAFAAGSGSDGKSNQRARPAKPTNVARADGTKQADGKSPTIDESFIALKRSVRRLSAIWKQQPENQKALQRELESVQTQAAEFRKVALRETTADKANDSGSPTAIAERPQGPVKPASKPPTKAQIERLIAELDRTHLPTKSPGEDRSTQRGSLEQISVQHRSRLCAALDEQLKTLEKLIEPSSATKQGFQDALEGLEKILLHIETGPRESSRQSRDE